MWCSESGSVSGSPHLSAELTNASRDMPRSPRHVSRPLPLAAGLLASHRESDDGEWRATFTIITRTGRTRPARSTTGCRSS